MAFVLVGIIGSNVVGLYIVYIYFEQKEERRLQTVECGNSGNPKNGLSTSRDRTLERVSAFSKMSCGRKCCIIYSYT